MSLVCARSVPAKTSRRREGNQAKAATYAAFPSVGAPRFELGTSSPPDWRANQAAPRPVLANHSA
jgi:hypothetical protein